MALPLAFINANNAARKNRDLSELINNRPDYNIQNEAFQNQDIARSEAYGRDRSIQLREQQAEQQTSDAAATAKDITSSTSSLLSTIAAIKANQDATMRGMAADEAAIKSQKKTQLLNVNNQMIDEKDKAWNYNINMPYQMKVAALRDRIKYNQEQAAQQFAASSNFMTSMFAHGQFNYQQPNSQQTQPQMNPGQYSTMNYRPMYGQGAYQDSGMS